MNDSAMWAIFHAKKHATEYLESRMKSFDYFLVENKDKFSQETLDYYKKEKQETAAAFSQVKQFFEERK